MITASSQQIYEKIPREDSVISLFKKDLDSNFEVNHATTKNRYADSKDMTLDNLVSIAFFKKYNLTTSSRKHSESLSHAQIVSLLFKLLTCFEPSSPC